MMQPHSSSPPNYFAILFPIGFVLFWIFVSTLIGALSGWKTLADSFPWRSDPLGQTRTAGPFFYPVYMRFWCQYRGVIRMTAADDALYLSVLGLFRAGHPPLRIPWSEIQLSKTTYAWQSYLSLTLGNRERIPMRISERMARNLGLLDRPTSPEPQARLRSWSAPSK